MMAGANQVGKVKRGLLTLFKAVSELRSGGSKALALRSLSALLPVGHQNPRLNHHDRNESRQDSLLFLGL